MVTDSDESSREQPVSPQPNRFEAFVAELQNNPTRAEESAEQLSQEFQLDLGVVQEILGQLKSDQSNVAFRRSRRSFRQLVTQIARNTKGAWMDATEHPYLFIFSVFALVGVMEIVLRIPIFSSVQSAAGPFLTLCGIIAVWGCIARHGKPVLAGFAAGLQFAVTMARPLLSKALGRTTETSAAEFATTLIQAIISSSTLLILGVVIAFVGLIVSEIRKNRLEERLSRQELLQRSFELQERLKQVTVGSESQNAGERMIQEIRRHAEYPVIAIAIALLVGVARVMLLSSTIDVEIPGLPIRAAFVWAMVFSLITIVVLFAIGYLAPSPRSSIISTVAGFLAMRVPEAIPRPGFGMTNLLAGVRSPEFKLELAGVLAVAMLTAAVLNVNKREMKRRRIRANDPATVAADLVRTHWRLYGRRRSLCVAVVDVAGSTRLKADAEPTRVEYSFRAFQNWVAQVTEEHGGKVVSTAGDGAVCSFRDVASALGAARTIQAGMERFNREENRLDGPFRLRIGLHAGEAETDLAHAPFNEIIDVAAHVERAAPVGGIALTRAVAMHLPFESMADLAERVDGNVVSVILNPDS